MVNKKMKGISMKKFNVAFAISLSLFTSAQVKCDEPRQLEGVDAPSISRDATMPTCPSDHPDIIDRPIPELK